MSVEPTPDTINAVAARPVQFHYDCEQCGSHVTATSPDIVYCTVPVDAAGRPVVRPGDLSGHPKCLAELDPPYAYMDDLRSAGWLRTAEERQDRIDHQAFMEAHRATVVAPDPLTGSVADRARRVAAGGTEARS